MAKPTFRSVTFEVSGSHDFPFDMLRYDMCSPYTGSDVTSILNDKYGSLGVRIDRTVKLVRFYPVGGRPEPEAARWASFGWRVISVDGRPL